MGEADTVSIIRLRATVYVLPSQNAMEASLQLAGGFNYLLSRQGEGPELLLHSSSPVNTSLFQNASGFFDFFSFSFFSTYFPVKDTKSTDLLEHDCAATA